MHQSKIGELVVSYHHSEEFHRLKQEVFTQHNYYLELDNPTPTIIDAGAYIGLATLYLKKLYPQAHIIAIEPNPQIIPILEENIWQNGLDNVEVHQVALTNQYQNATLYHDATNEAWFSTASLLPGAWNGKQNTTEVSVPGKPLAEFITGRVDLLKMDIEGSEWEVLVAARDRLHLVDHLIMEFHPHSKQKLADMITFLEEVGFETTVERKGNEVTSNEMRLYPGRLVYIRADRPMR